MPKDMGAFDAQRLRRQLNRDFEKRPSVDETSWEESGRVCVARTVHAYREPFTRALALELKKELDEMLPDPEETESFFGHQFYRDWILARGTDLANVWYRGPEDSVAADIVDCEAMVRSIRFDP
jgi:hypothetical protein